MPGAGASPKDVAIVVPTHKATLSADERISLRHLEHYLGSYDKFLIIPEGLDLELPGCMPLRFDPACFSSVQAFSRLCLSEAFYSAFADYRYILTYQLDCLVFSDQLADWCARGYDYVGAPWFKRPGLGWTYDDPERAGAGGLSLRHVAHCLEAIRHSNQTGVADVVRSVAKLRPGRRFLGNLKEALLRKRNAAASFPNLEDIWWAMHAPTYLPSFRLAPIEVAVGFAFETEPRYCFERNGGHLPFGCHAWARYDRSFWEPYLLT